MNKTERRYLLGGFTFGMLFPAVAWITEFWLRGLIPSLDALAYIHQENLILWIVDSAPLVLGATFFFIGKKQAHIQKISQNLRRDVAQTNDELTESQERIVGFVNSSTHRFWEADTEHRFTYISSGRDKVLEKLAQHVIGKRRWELPLMKASDEAWAQHKADIDARRPIEDFRCHMEDVDGIVRYFSINGEPVYDNNGEFKGYRGSIADITDLVDAANAIKASERKYQLLFQHANDSMFIIDPDGLRIIDANIVAAKRLGYSREELIGMSMYEINMERIEGLKRGEEEHLNARFEHMRREGNLTFETSHRRKDGSILPVEVSSHFIEVDGRTVVESIARDITERKKMEKMKNEFISTVSHELRTPLTSIVGSLGLARSDMFGDMDDQVKQIVEIAHNNSQRLVRLINDILDIEKIESGKMDLDQRPIELHELVAQAVEENEPFAAQFDVTLQIKPNGVQQTSVIGDWDRLLQVMANLLSNASKFSPAGSKIDVGVIPDGKTARIFVSDKGPGVKNEFRDTIFEKFTQSDMSDSKEKGGTGLGLNISKAIVEMHGGVIGFENKRDGGTTFYFDLPLN